MAELKVTLLASTQLHDLPESIKGTGFESRSRSDMWHERESEADLLIEVAGRACYQSWNLPNEKTAENAGYIANVTAQGHFSVFEHASATFYVEGVSRALTHELIRHRHLSFSELSQRFVNMEEAAFVVPPALIEATEAVGEDATDLHSLTVAEAIEEAVEAYRDVYAGLTERGYSRKAAREAARAALPNGTETKIVVTGNLRAWRDVLYKRYHVAADREIRDFAAEVLRQLRDLAPNAFADFPQVPFGTEEEVAA